jgi:hypothetical protein
MPSVATEHVGSLLVGEHHGDVVLAPVGLRQCHQLRTGGLDVCSPLYNEFFDRSLFDHIRQPIGAKQERISRRPGKALQVWGGALQTA